MCCFSRPVQRVAETNIFARTAKEGRQFLVYSMTFKAGEDLAMILPLPVPKDVKEDAVSFINLEKYADFFKDLEKGFPREQPLGLPPTRSKDAPKAEAPLKVVEVGGFEASFVPAVKDFARLDARFRLDDGVWDKLGQYRDYGFAVFKLKQGEKRVHPMAFDFPRRDAKLFFPTVHIHDGKVHDKAKFDHALFCQVAEGERLPAFGWEESPQHAVEFVKIDKAQGIVEKAAHVYRHEMRGTYKNQDLVV
jgi:hypothetical protein